MPLSNGLAPDAAAFPGTPPAARSPTAAVKAEPIVLDREGDAADAFRIIARACMRQFLLNEALLEHGDVEALHQARVGLRRLRSAFSIHAPLLVGDRRAALLSAELRWLAAELGEVRNLDVLIARCGGDVRDRLAAARDQAFDHARAELAGARTRLLMTDLAEWLAAGAWWTEPVYPARLHRPVIGFAADLLDARFDRLARRGGVQGKGLARLDRAHRHKERIAAKKLRYAAEFFASLYVGDKARRRYRRFLKALDALQEVLGELNDLAVGPDVLARLGIDATLPGTSAHRRKRLLDRAGDSYDALMRAGRFW